jgi:putative transposase
MATHSRSSARRSPHANATKRPTHGCRHRLAIGEDDRKRGIHGYDGAKKIGGRKRHILVDTTGLLLRAIVHAADIKDPASAPLLFSEVMKNFDQIQLVWADMGYRSDALRAWMAENSQWKLEIVKRPSKWGRYPVDVEPEPMPRFTVLARRWVVERTFAWIGRYRRMSKDYEYLIESSETMIYIVMSRLMLRRLARNAAHGVKSPQRMRLKGAARAS